MFGNMAVGTGRATHAERRNRKSGLIIRTAKNAGRVPARKRGGKFHFSAVNSSFFLITHAVRLVLVYGMVSDIYNSILNIPFVPKLGALDIVFCIICFLNQQFVLF